VISLVLDASVVAKWVFSEEDSDHSLAILDGVRSGKVQVLQPPHWLAEVAAVAVRLDPGVASEVVQLLDAMELPVANDISVYTTACDLAAELGHHLFDTLYHAVALRTEGAKMITADDRYFRKARHKGAIARLRDFAVHE
jgi:predicted nucleic acid-binding protein